SSWKSRRTSRTGPISRGCSSTGAHAAGGSARHWCGPPNRRRETAARRCWSWTRTRAATPSVCMRAWAGSASARSRATPLSPAAASAARRSSTSRCKGAARCSADDRLRRRWFAAYEVIDDGAERGAGERGDDVEPERVHVAADQRGPDRAGGVHGGAGDRAAEHRVQADGAANRNRCSFADRAGIGRDGHDHEHQEEGEHELPEERLTLRAARQAGSHVADVAERAAQDRRRRERAEDLCRPVAERTCPRELAAEREGEADGGVEMGAGDV